MSSKEQLEQYTREVEEVIKNYLPTENGYQRTVLEAMNYSMKAGGKRLRPLFMREVYRLFSAEQGNSKSEGTRQEQVVEPFMAAIEMIHTFSLVHDDLPCMDNDRLRRGKPTTWVQYGYDMAVLAGDALTIYAFETASRAFSMSNRTDAVGRCIGLLASKAGVYGMIGGQTLDVELTGKPVDKEQMDFIYRLKTGALLEAPMMIGAILGGAEEKQVEAVEKMATCIGLAFQIQDDILDLTSTTEKLGKPTFSDEKNEKTTYVTLYGMEQAKQAVRDLSGQAEEILKSLPGNHSFLMYLINLLITREK
ncbi:MAG: polyprenyl synthetase family protein [Hungatella sp.]|nr:polyprenyl synthetase family protein [Hungatella sp.]